MDERDKKDLAAFGFRRSKGRLSRKKLVIVLTSVLVIIFAVWFVIFRH
jgi:hypothetical protein